MKNVFANLILIAFGLLGSVGFAQDAQPQQPQASAAPQEWTNAPATPPTEAKTALVQLKHLDPKDLPSVKDAVETQLFDHDHIGVSMIKAEKGGYNLLIEAGPDFYEVTSTQPAGFAKTQLDRIRFHATRTVALLLAPLALNSASADSKQPLKLIPFKFILNKKSTEPVTPAHRAPAGEALAPSGEEASVMGNGGDVSAALAAPAVTPVFVSGTATSLSVSE